MGDFLKELDLTEGRSTGVPTIQEKLADNGSPRATFETTEDRLTFLIHIPIHAGCGDKVIQNDTTGVPQGVPQDEHDDWIVEQIRKNRNITTKELGRLSGWTSKTIKRRISKLPQIKYIGSGYSGHWEVEEENK